MQRICQVLFVLSILLLSWLGMMAVHELGHVIGACCSGGSVERVVLHPLSISRTDVSPNPHPGIVVWCGPLLGCLFPVVAAVFVPLRQTELRNLAWWFGGFCLVANGAYIAVGSIEGVGDCGQMLRSGTPAWAMWLFGAVVVPLGLVRWHRLGSPADFLRDPTLVSPKMALLASTVLTAVVIAECLLCSR